MGYNPNISQFLSRLQSTYSWFTQFLWHSFLEFETPKPTQSSEKKSEKLMEVDLNCLDCLPKNTISVYIYIYMYTFTLYNYPYMSYGYKLIHMIIIYDICVYVYMEPLPYIQNPWKVTWNSKDSWVADKMFFLFQPKITCSACHVSFDGFMYINIYIYTPFWTPSSVSTKLRSTLLRREKMWILQAQKKQRISPANLPVFRKSNRKVFSHPKIPRVFQAVVFLGA